MTGSGPAVTAKGRCSWCGADPVYVAYHDHEWGVPVHADRELFAKLILDGFQAGLSWITILKRQESFRRAFANWNARKIAAFTPKDVARLLQDRGIIRNRLKIEAAITNARAYLRLKKELGSFDRYLWQFTGHKTLCRQRRHQRWRDIPATSTESAALSRDLKKRGFRFVGPTICYAFMQAVGMVDDHVKGCFRADLTPLDIKRYAFS